MEQLKAKINAPKKKNGSKGTFDDMGNLIPDVSDTLNEIDAALDASSVAREAAKKAAAELQRQEQQRQQSKTASCCSGSCCGRR